MVGWYATGIRYTTDMTTCTEYAVRDSGDLLGREGSSRDILGRHAGKSCAGTCQTGILGRDTGQEMAAGYAAGHPGDMPQGHLQGHTGQTCRQGYRRMSAGQSGSVAGILAGLPGRDILGGHVGGVCGGGMPARTSEQASEGSGRDMFAGMSQDMLGGECSAGLSAGNVGGTCLAEIVRTTYIGRDMLAAAGRDIGRADGENAVMGMAGGDSLGGT